MVARGIIWRSAHAQYCRQSVVLIGRILRPGRPGGAMSTALGILYWVATSAKTVAICIEAGSEAFSQRLVVCNPVQFGYPATHAGSRSDHPIELIIKPALIRSPRARAWSRWNILPALKGPMFMADKKHKADGVIARVVFQHASQLHDGGRAGSIVPGARGAWLAVQGARQPRCSRWDTDCRSSLQ